MTYEKLPVSLLEQAAAYYDVPELPTMGCPPVWRIVRSLQAQVEPEDADVEEALRWVAEQAPLQQHAAGLIEALEAAYPTPTTEEVISGAAVFAPWHAEQWWLTLKFYPWAERLDEAIEYAEAALGELDG